MVVDRIEQRPPQEELAAEDLPFGGLAIVRIVQQADVEQLASVVPLVDGVGEVDALVALKPYEACTQHLGHHLGSLRLADPGFALDEERLAELESEEDGGGEGPVADVAVRAQ